MKRILVIDDLRIFDPLPDEEIVTVRTAEAGRIALGDGTPRWDECWLDHDLGYDATGLKVDIRGLVSEIEEWGFLEMKFNVGMFVIITDNPSGRDWMIAALSPYYPVEVGKREYTIDWGETPA